MLAGLVAHLEEWPSRPARTAPVPDWLHPLLRARLDERGVQRLYTHQAQALEAARRGQDLVVATGTNSGKTWCYALPTLDALLREPAARALWIFPTKALAQDQTARLKEMAPSGIKVGTYDGDTPQSARSGVRREAHVVVTNPDMLHVGILPGHDHWAKFLRSLRVIVLDEVHVYRGVFGSHVGNVVRRLLRLAEWHRARPLVVACSATIGNPESLFETLTGRRATLVDDDGSPRGRRTFAFVNPPEVAEGRRLSANTATADTVAMLAESGQRTLAFSRARVSAELVLRAVRRRLAAGGELPPEAADAYRAGYTPKERRQIEQALFSGRLRALSATNAMELGVDVGTLDAVVLNGYPGTASSFWQQAGRAGRGERDGLAVYVAHDDPLEQFLLREPERLLSARQENVSARPENEAILRQHLLCAAHERPLAPSELERFGASAVERAEELDRSGELQFRAGLFFYPGFDPPALRVSLRSSDADTVRLVLAGEELGHMEKWRATAQAHPGAVYLHRGQTFIVDVLDLEAGIARVSPFDGTYYTQPIQQSVIEVLADLDADGPWRLQRLRVSDTVVGFRKRSLDGESVLDVEELDMPTRTFETVGVRRDLPGFSPEGGDAAAHIAGVHGTEHALLAVAPWLAGCDRGDLGSAWYTVFPDARLGPAVFVFDRTPGGIGFAEGLYRDRYAWAAAARGLLEGCACEDGCPACLLSPRCECANEALGKGATLSALATARVF